MVRDQPPPEVVAAARRRSEARAARDWPAADGLRAEIEAAGWRVVDVGNDFRLESASPPELEVEGEIRYGRSDAVPSRLDSPATGVATVVLIVDRGDPRAAAAVGATGRHTPAGADLVVVGDGIDDATAEAIRAELDASSLAEADRELIRTSARLGRAAALNAGIRRARGSIVVVLDPSIEPTGDAVSPLVNVLDDPTVAIVGPFGLASADLRHFDEVVATAVHAPKGVDPEPDDVAAVQGYAMAFRRADAEERGPLDEGFRFYRNLDIWWSLVLRDEGEGATPRRAVIVPRLPLERHEPWAWTSTPAADRERLSKRNFYRVLDRFRTRLDLASP